MRFYGSSMDLSLACVLLIVFALMWLVGSLVPRLGIVGQIGQWLWVLFATLLLCGLHVS